MQFLLKSNRPYTLDTNSTKDAKNSKVDLVLSVAYTTTIATLCAYVSVAHIIILFVIVERQIVFQTCIQCPFKLFQKPHPLLLNLSNWMKCLWLAQKDIKRLKNLYCATGAQCRLLENVLVLFFVKIIAIYRAENYADDACLFLRIFTTLAVCIHIKL